MSEPEDLDLSNPCPLCASPNVITNKKGQRVCRDCGNIAPAGSVVSTGVFSKIKGIFAIGKKEQAKPKDISIKKGPKKQKAIKIKAKKSKPKKKKPAKKTKSRSKKSKKRR